MNVAIDVEGVLANTDEGVVRSTDRLSLKQIRNTWFSNNKQSDEYQIYMGVSDAVWRHKPELIPPEEPDLANYVKEIREAADTVDILTHREHVDKSVVWWLSENNIEYDNYISTNVPKWEFDYDVFVDDNPKMFGECRLLLRHQPWNVDADDTSSASCDRIHSLAEVTDYLH